MLLACDTCLCLFNFSSCHQPVFLKRSLTLGKIVSALPWGPEDEKTPAGIETVIAAETVRPARGRILQEVLVKREAGGVQRIVLDHVGDEEDANQAVVEIKEEAID